MAPRTVTRADLGEAVYQASAASIPLALCEAIADGRVQRGDLVMTEAMGGGFTWGSALLRW